MSYLKIVATVTMVAYYLAQILLLPYIIVYSTQSKVKMGLVFIHNQFNTILLFITINKINNI